MVAIDRARWLRLLLLAALASCGDERTAPEDEGRDPVHEGDDDASDDDADARAGDDDDDARAGDDDEAATDAGATRDGGRVDAGTDETPRGADDAQVLASDARASEPMDAEARPDARAPDAAGASSDAAEDASAQPDSNISSLPGFHIPLRVHRGRSGLTGEALAAVLEEVNEIWWKQASICFEVEIVRDDQVRRDGFDLWFHRSGLGCNANGNGVYCGDHDIHSLDAPSLGRTDDPAWDTRQNPARTAAHELGHGLNLDHYNGFPDSNDSLMASGRQGYKLHQQEIATARRRAPQKAIAGSPSQPCAPVPVVD